MSASVPECKKLRPNDTTRTTTQTLAATKERTHIARCLSPLLVFVHRSPADDAMALVHRERPRTRHWVSMKVVAEHFAARTGVQPDKFCKLAR